MVQKSPPNNVTSFGPQGEFLQYLDASGNFVRDDVPEISDADLINIFKLVLKIRVLEERMIRLQRTGRIGFYIGTHGEEMTHVGSTYALRNTDLVYPAYREVGPALYRGYPIQDFIHQLFGNCKDSIKGRQMPNHHSAKSLNIASISSPVGTQIPQCTGSAWAAKIRGDDQVSICFFGEGTSSEGDFHCGLNFAAVYKAPAIFVLRNNGWAISEPASVQSATKTFHVKAKAYGMTGIRVDGNDIFAMVGATREAADRARKGLGPTLIEAVTYRLGPHSTSDDPSKYRPEGEYEFREKLEPMIRLRILLQRKGLFTEEDEQEYRATIEKEVLNAARIAEAQARPEKETIFTDVFEEMPPHIERQYRYSMQFPPIDPPH
jgi:pyruvate dehydrogenase E1 component alpha subunit